MPTIHWPALAFILGTIVAAGIIWFFVVPLLLAVVDVAVIGALTAGDGVLIAARDQGIVLHGPLTYLSDLGRKARRRG